MPPMPSSLSEPLSPAPRAGAVACDARHAPSPRAGVAHAAVAAPTGEGRGMALYLRTGSHASRCLCQEPWRPRSHRARSRNRVAARAEASSMQHCACCTLSAVRKIGAALSCDKRLLHALSCSSPPQHCDIERGCIGHALSASASSCEAVVQKSSVAATLDGGLHVVLVRRGRLARRLTRRLVRRPVLCLMRLRAVHDLTAGAALLEVRHMRLTCAA